MAGQLRRTASWGEGIYENEYVKEDSIWKIKALHAYSRFSAAYEDGWVKSALLNAGPEKSFPVDRPPTVTYESYPTTFAAPFRYKNPRSAEIAESRLCQANISKAGRTGLCLLPSLRRQRDQRTSSEGQKTAVDR